MTRKALAKALRRRLLRQGLAEPSRVHTLPDHEIIHAYSKCAMCKARLFTNETAAVSAAADLAEFLNLCEMALAAHACPAKN